MSDHAEHSFTPEEMADFANGNKEIPLDPESPEAIDAAAKAEAEKAAEKPADEKEAPEAKAPETKTPEALPAPSGVDPEYEGWMNEFQTTGELSAESSKAAMDKIFHPDLSDEEKQGLLAQYLGGFKAGGDIATMNAWNVVGGQENFDKIMAWARVEDSIPADVREAINQQLTEGNGAAQKMALETLQTRYQTANPNKAEETPADEPSMNHVAASAGGLVISSRQQLAAAQNDPRYDTDSHYREQVHAALNAAVEAKTYRSH